MRSSPYPKDCRGVFAERLEGAAGLLNGPKEQVGIRHIILFFALRKNGLDCRRVSVGRI